MPLAPRRSAGAVGLLAAAAAALPLAVTGSAVGAEPGTEAPAPVCRPTPENRPVCAASAVADQASFIDPTAFIPRPEFVELEHQVYVAPFARLAAERGARITIGAESNVQDNVRVSGSVPRPRAVQTAMADAGLPKGSGVVLGERVILAHGSEVRGPARIGVDASEYERPDDPQEQPSTAPSDEPSSTPPSAGTSSVSASTGPSAAEPAAAEEEQDSGVFLSFGAQVDGAVIERDTALSALSRVGPGVVLRSGTVVLPGKNVTTQEEADDRSKGKVRDIMATDFAFNAGVVEVNVGLAREYTELFRDDATAVQGFNVDPGGNEFDQSRDAPTVESALCTGPEVRVPDARNRVIGDVCFEDSLDDLDRKLGSSISIRADEGGPFGIGTITQMDDRVIFHALEGSDLQVGERVDYGSRTIVHGGGRPQVDATTGLAAPTIIGNDVVLGAQSVVFRSLLRNGTEVGYKSAVVGSQTDLDQEIDDRTIYANDTVFGLVEW